MQNARLDEGQAGNKIAGKNINNLRYADDTTLMAESEEELRSLLMNIKEEIDKFGLKLNIKKTKIMTSGPINSWQIDGETMETVTGFIFLGSKITANGDCSHEIKTCLFLGRKAMTNKDSILKSIDISLPTKVHLLKAMVFLMVIYWCKSWTIKKAECQRIDAFELWCWRRLLRVPWPARRSNQSVLGKSVLNIHWKDWCWNWNSNNLANWYEELTLEKTLILGKTEGRRRKKAKSPKICRSSQQTFFQGRYVDGQKTCEKMLSSVQLLSSVRLFVTPWIAAHQASLSIINSQSPPKPMSIQSVMPSNHLILCCSLLLLSSIFPSIRIFSNESALCIRWPKNWSFSFNVSPSNEHPGLISFRMDWLDLLAAQGTLESSPTPQFKSINSTVLSRLYSPTLTSIHGHWKSHSLD